jgi:hypothetical protein
MEGVVQTYIKFNAAQYYDSSYKTHSKIFCYDDDSVCVEESVT